MTIVSLDLPLETKEVTEKGWGLAAPDDDSGNGWQ